VQKTLTSFGIAAVILELKERLQGARIQNIYQKGRIFILKLHQPSQPPMNLLIEPGKRLHLTSYVVEKPEKPPAFCMALRKHLRNSIITEISQHEFERIVILKARTKEGEFKLVVELFGDGNIILIDSRNLIKQALAFKRMRDRNILRRGPFEHAPSSGRNPLQLESAHLLDLKSFEGVGVVRALTRFLSIGGSYAEEVLLRAHLDKNKTCESLGDSELERIFNALRELVQPIELGKLEPCIVTNKSAGWVDAIPISLKKYEGLECKRFAGFNEALDEFYAKTLVVQEASVVSEKFGEHIARQQRILDEQKESLEKAKNEAEEMRRVGEKIYAHFHLLQALTQRIMNEKKEGKTWQQIVSAIEHEKRCGNAPAVYFESLDTKNLFLNLCIDDLSFHLTLRDSVQANASAYYERAKKNEKKTEGAQNAIKETLRAMDELKQQRGVAKEQVAKPKKKRRKAWYEKFRWFHSSEGLLVVGGKDAVTNEILIKKHTEHQDLVFHADMVGAPFVVVKTEGKTPSQQSISEAAQLAASYSRAWKAKFSSVDVYWVYPAQVSKTPPSGGYLPKGAFMIRGRKNYVRKTPLRLAIGIDTKATPPVLIGGPKKAVENKTQANVEIVPGDLSSKELANRIRHILKQKTPKRLQEEISKIPLEQIQAFIPSGNGSTANQ
jgi:predicted ribosome quality control (RQC) complex YloA/Tae2 family protein